MGSSSMISISLIFHWNPSNFHWGKPPWILSIVLLAEANFVHQFSVGTWEIFLYKMTSESYVYLFMIYTSIGLLQWGQSTIGSGSFGLGLIAIRINKFVPCVQLKAPHIPYQLLSKRGAILCLKWREGKLWSNRWK